MHFTLSNNKKSNNYLQKFVDSREKDLSRHLVLESKQILDFISKSVTEDGFAAEFKQVRALF